MVGGPGLLVTDALRVPTDDVFSMRFAWLTHGKVPPTGLKAHDDLMAEFPFVGPPNP